VYDRAAVTSDFNVQLIDDEVERGGVFAPLHDWLDDQIDKQQANGFYRPYQGIIDGGVAPERWHLSHQVTAEHFSRLLNAETLYNVLKKEKGMRLRDTVLENFDEIFTQYIAY
ncbi:MAG: hypothetical protein P8J42_06095, partial [Pseudomonadales bacterium]|nr:hypothetical protein [Pseudomonadales bacterium]